MEKKVKDYIERLPSPQKEICYRVRKIILQTFPKLKESFKNGVPWYEDKYYIVGLKDHVNIGFAIEGLTSEELSLLEGRGKIMRHLKIYQADDIDEERIVKLLKMIK